MTYESRSIVLGILCFAIGSLLALYYLPPSSPARNLHTANNLVADTRISLGHIQVIPKQPEDRRAVQKQAEEAYLDYLENLKLYITPQNIGLFILVVGIVWAIASNWRDEEKYKPVGDPISSDDSDRDHRGGDDKGPAITLSYDKADSNKGDKALRTITASRTKSATTLSKAQPSTHKGDNTYALQEVAKPQNSTLKF